MLYSSFYHLFTIFLVLPNNFKKISQELIKGPNKVDSTVYTFPLPALFQVFIYSFFFGSLSSHILLILLKRTVFYHPNNKDVKLVKKSSYLLIFNFKAQTQNFQIKKQMNQEGLGSNNKLKLISYFFMTLINNFRKDDLMLFPNIYIFYIRKVMCFLKKLRPLDEISHQKGNENPPAPYEETTKDTLDHSFLNELLNSKNTVVMSKGDQLLMNLTQLINFNNEQINMIEEKLQQNFQLISDLNSKVNEEKIEKDSHDCMKEENQSAHQSQETFVDHQNQVEPLIKRLFGKEKYLYRLQLQEEFPTTIYKERNFNFSFALVNNNQEKILNSNIIHLCLEICDATGEWINENKAGENFMKGKTEIEMYHGEGSFVKVYPRDVSRHHPEGKINIVVYTKPSMIKFSNNASSVERIVSSEEIEPLLIKDITIKSKKKE